MKLFSQQPSIKPTVKTDSSKLQTDTVKWENVERKAETTNSNSKAYDNFFDDVASSEETRNSTNSKTIDTLTYSGKDIIAKIELNKTTVYKGEQLEAEYAVYSLIPLDIKKIPSLIPQGFWIHELPIEDSMFRAIKVNLDGKSYFKYVLSRLLIFPISSGQIRIPSFAIVCEAELETNKAKKSLSGSLADMFKLKALESKILRVVSNEKQLHVNELPKSTSSAFNGLVGYYKLNNINFDSSQIEKGYVTIEYIIRGEGNMKFIPLIPITSNDDWEIGEPIIKDSFYVSEKKLTGIRSMKFFMSSHIEGVNFTPEFLQVFFNPTQNKYENLLVERKKIVSNGEIGIKHLNSELKDIITTRLMIDEENIPFRNIYFLALVSISILIPFFATLYKKHSNQQILKKNRELSKLLALKGFENAKTQLQLGNLDSFYDQLYNVLWGYIKGKFGIALKNTNEDEVVKLFLQHELSQEDINRFTMVNNACQAKLYAKFQSDCQHRNLLEDLENLIHNIENHLHDV